MHADLLCFSHLRWNFVWQRPQHLMTRAAGSRHVWVIEEPLGTAGPSYLQITEAAPNLTVVVPMLDEALDEEGRSREQQTLLSRLPVHAAATGPVHWYYTPMARAFARGLPAGAVVYDCMDELSAFAGAPPALRMWEAELLAAADVVFTGGASLYEAKRGSHPTVHAFPSSVEVEHFRSARSGQRDLDAQAGIPHPRIGFAGVIDERLDCGLMAGLARLRPQYQFVLVGPVVKIDPAILPRGENLHYLGMQAYRDLPRLLAHWDAAILPFARNDATRFISPTKTPEYLAAGRRVVSTSIRDVVDPYGVKRMVEIADDPEAFGQALDRVLAGTPADWLAAVDEHLSTLSWDRTWQQMHTHVLQAEARRTGAPRPPRAFDPSATAVRVHGV